MRVNIVRDILLLVLVASLLVSIAFAHNHDHGEIPHKCIHDDIMEEESKNRYHPRSLFSQIESSHASQRRHTSKRSSLYEVWSNLRVVFRFDYLGSSDVEQRSCASVGAYYWEGVDSPSNIPGTPSCASATSTNCWRQCTSSDVPTTDYINIIKRDLLPAVKEDFFLMAQTRSVQDGDYTTAFRSISRCGSRGGVPVPDDIKQSGFDGKNADVIIFVTTRPTQEGVLGWAVACVSSAEHNRPIAGQLNLSPRLIGYTLQEKYSVAKHECLHALGFSQTFLNYFYDRNTTKSMPASSVYFMETKQFTDSTGAQKTASVMKIKTPKVLDIARKYFGCSTLDGLQMEEGGGSGTAFSHWEKRIMKNELMVGSVSGELVTSSFTIAFLEDSGWYRGNFSHSQALLWGKGMGCPMADGRCEDWPVTDRPGYYCTDDPAISTCTFDLKKKGYCSINNYVTSMGYYEHVPGNPKSGGSDALMDYCPVVSSYAQGSCFSGYESKYDVEVFGDASACFDSNIVRILTSQKAKDSRCLRISCDDGVLGFYVGNTKFSCPSDQSPETKTNMPATYTGYVKCPINGYEILCKNKVIKTSNYAINGTYENDGGTTEDETVSQPEKAHNSKGPCFFGIFFCSSASSSYERAIVKSVTAVVTIYSAVTLVLMQY